VLDALSSLARWARRATRKPRITVVGHHVGDELAGAERSLLDILAAVDRTTFDLSCVLPASNESYLRAVRRHTDRVTVFPYGLSAGRARPLDPASIARFQATFAALGTDLVHVNTITLLEPLVAARRLGVRSIVHARELVDEDAELADLLGDTAPAIIATLRETADFIIANSDATHRLYRKPGASTRVHNCVDAEHLDLPNDVVPGRLEVGIISRNIPTKGVDAFVRLADLASRARPGLRFHVVGPPSEHARALAETEAARRGNLCFSGYVNDPREALRRLNVVVSFSVVTESFGRTLAEAMAARRPVIAYDRGAAPELVRHGVDGFLVPFLDLDRALEHLGALLDDPARVQEMGRSGRARVLARFSPAVFAPQLDAVYRGLLGRGLLGRTRSMRRRSSP
jgi:glycosyltransferase involved in cell wall biosynthesis